MEIETKIVLIIDDGWGIAKAGPGNYIKQANTPNFDYYIRHYPHSKNKASGAAVGLPDGVQGNSEVGHLHIGAGRIIWQMYELINRRIKDKTFYSNKQLLKALNNAKINNSALHLIGLCSDEGVHAHINHLFAILKLAKQNKIKDIFIHFFADGRDVEEKSAKKYIEQIEQNGIGKIITICGRYYSMDRDNNWNRTKKAYDLLTKGVGHKSKNAIDAIEMAYRRGDKTDYYIKPIALDGFTPIKDNDTVIFFNFRTDRPRQLTKAFTSSVFNHFKRDTVLKTHFLTMSNYDKTFSCPHMFDEDPVKNNLGQVISNEKLKQLRLAETEKYAHVTYFFNSQIEKPNKGEDRVMISSPKVPSYDKKPEMSAKQIAKEAHKQINKKKYDFILINFANLDLVGHSAKKKAIIRAVEVVDVCTKFVVDAALKNGYTCIITADHGSAEEKLYPNGLPKPAHSSNPVNLIVVTNDRLIRQIKLRNGGQSDVAPTILEMMGIEIPYEMTGKSLIKNPSKLKRFLKIDEAKKRLRIN